MMIESLKLIANLPRETIIYPGHGEQTVLTDELKFNDEFIQAVL